MNLETLLRREGVYSISVFRSQWNDGRQEEIVCKAELDSRFWGTEWLESTPQPTVAEAICALGQWVDRRKEKAKP